MVPFISCLMRYIWSTLSPSFELFSEHWRTFNIKDRISFFSLFLRSTWKWNVFHMNRGTDRGEEHHILGMSISCWKPRPPNISNMLSIKNTSTYLLESECCFFSHSRTRHLYLCWLIVFIEQSGTTSFNLSFILECGIVV